MEIPFGKFRTLKKEELRVLFDVLPGKFGVYLWDGKTLERFGTTEDFPALTGLSENEYNARYSKDCSQVFLPVDRPAVVRSFNHSVESEVPFDNVFRIFQKEAGCVWLHLTGRPFGLYEGKVALLMTFIETSFESQGESALLNHSNDAIYLVDKNNFELLYANETAKHLWGKEQLGISGKTCYAHLLDKKEKCDNCVFQYLKNGRCHLQSYYFNSVKGYFDVDCEEVKWQGREAIAIYAHDVSERKRHEDSLAFDRKEIDSLLGNLIGGVAIFSDEQGEIRLDYVNDGFYVLHHGSRSFWAKENANPVKWLLEEDQHLFNDEFALVKAGKKAFGSVTYRVWGEDEEPHWVRNDFRKAYIRNGIQYYYASFTDLDDQKEAERQENDLRQMYERAIEASQLAVWEYDIPERRIVMAENNYTRTDIRKFGIEHVEDNVPESLYQYIDDASLPAFKEMYEKIAKGEPSVSCEVWYRSRLGVEPRFERITYTTTFDSAGKPIKAYGIGQNLTSQRLEQENYVRFYQWLNETLSGALASFRLDISQNSYIDGFSSTEDVDVSFVSSSADEHFFKFAKLIIDPKIQSEILSTFTCENLIRLFKDGTRLLSRVYPIRSKKGNIIWLESTLNLLQNPNSGSIEGVSSTKNVTQGKKDEQILLALAQSATDFIGLCDPLTRQCELHYGGWHKAIYPSGSEATYETAQNYIAKRGIPEKERPLFLAESDLAMVVQALEAKGSYAVAFNFLDEGKLTRKQIRYRYLNEEKNEILVMQSDITETTEKERRQIAQLQDALLEAEKANSAKSEFVSRISHDIRTPISIISSMTAFAIEDKDEPEKLLNDLHKIEASNTFLLSLINDVLDISKIDAGKVELHPETYLFADFLSNVENMFNPLFAKKNQKFRIVQSLEGEGIVIDKIRLNQLALNLLSNAAKYTMRGGEVVLTLGAKKVRGNTLDVTLQVQDDGIGMSEEFQKTLFTPFSQEVSNPNREREMLGTGLGLAIVKRIVNLFHGTIEVKSVLGKGSTFAIRFNAPEANLSLAKDVVAAPKEEAAPLKGNILLAEDNPFNAEIAKRILSSFGLSVVWAKNGQEAIDDFAAAIPGAYQAVVMDIQMPIKNGYEAAEGIRSLKNPEAQSIPIIAMTADAFSAALERCKEAGMNDYITKPINPELLRKTLEKYLVSK
jgi:PAS domain S-box-containing protein